MQYTYIVMYNVYEENILTNLRKYTKNVIKKS